MASVEKTKLDMQLKCDEGIINVIDEYRQAMKEAKWKKIIKAGKEYAIMLDKFPKNSSISDIIDFHIKQLEGEKTKNNNKVNGLQYEDDDKAPDTDTAEDTDTDTAIEKTKELKKLNQKIENKINFLKEYKAEIVKVAQAKKKIDMGIEKYYSCYDDKKIY